MMGHPVRISDCVLADFNRHGRSQLFMAGIQNISLIVDRSSAVDYGNICSAPFIVDVNIYVSEKNKYPFGRQTQD